QRGQAAEQRTDEDDPAVCFDGDVVDVEVAGGVADLGEVESIVAVVQEAGPQCVLEAPELIQAAHPERLPVAPQAHAAVEGALEDGEPAVGLHADQEEFAGLVSGEGQADALLGEPGGGVARGVDLEPRLLGRGRGHGDLRGCSTAVGWAESARPTLLYGTIRDNRRGNQAEWTSVSSWNTWRFAWPPSSSACPRPGSAARRGCWSVPSWRCSFPPRSR